MFCSAVARGKVFAVGLCQACRSVTQVKVLPEVTVHTLVSLLQGRRVRQQKRQPCKYHLDRFFAFNTKDGRTMLFACFARLSDTTSWTHLAAAHNVSASHCFSSVNYPQPSSMTVHSHSRHQFGNWCFTFSLHPWFAHAYRIVKM